MKIVIIVLFGVFLSGCATVDLTQHYTDGLVKENISEFDGTREVLLPVSYLRDKKIKLGAFWSSKLKDSIVLTAEIRGAKTFSFEESLQLNIDGKIHNLSSIDKTTEIRLGSLSWKIAQVNHSSKRYMIKKDLLTKIMSAKKTVVRLNLQKEYVVDVFALPKEDIRPLKWAVDGFKDFVTAISKPEPAKDSKKI